MSETDSDPSDPLDAVVEELGQFVGVERAEEIVSTVAADADATSDLTGESDVIRVCRLIEERHSGVVASVASEFRVRREAEQRFTNLLTTIPDPVCVVTGDEERLRVRDANRACAEAFDVDRGDVESTSLASLLGRFDEDPPVERIRTAVADRRRSRFEVSLETSEGTRHYIVRVSPFEGRVDAPRAILLFTDITEQKRREQRLLRLREIGDVLNRILRHNLRNDLNVVLGVADTLRNEATGAAEQIDRLDETARGLLELSENARDVQQAIRRDHDTERVDVVAVVEREAEAVRRAYPEATVETTLVDEAWAWADSDLATVFDHLFDNAIRHNDGPDPLLEVELDAEPDAEAVVARVRDNGPGIPSEELEAVVSGSETPLQHGSGLGLWLIRWLVDQYDGDVRFDTGPVGPTEVTVRLPAADPPDAGSGA